MNVSTVGLWVSNGGEKKAVKEKADRVMVLEFLYRFISRPLGKSFRNRAPQRGTELPRHVLLLGKCGSCGAPSVVS